VNGCLEKLYVGVKLKLCVMEDVILSNKSKLKCLHFEGNFI